MEKDLKAQNVRALTAIYGSTLFLMAVVQWSVGEAFAISLQFGQQVFVGAVMTSFGAVLSNFCPNAVKHTLVYFRLRNVLSGHRCRRLCLNDPRLMPADLERKWPKLFFRDMREMEQNNYWYKEIYRSVRNEPEVLQAHRYFLLFRDAASGLFVLLVGLLLWKTASEVAPTPALSMWAMAALFAVVLFLCQAARQSGDRMVINAVTVALSR